MQALKMGYTFHTLRHTHASRHIGKGTDILTLSRRLGHSKAAVTLDVYGHLMPGADRAAADAVASVILINGGQPAGSY